MVILYVAVVGVSLSTIIVKKLYLLSKQGFWRESIIVALTTYVVLRFTRPMLLKAFKASIIFGPLRKNDSVVKILNSRLYDLPAPVNLRV